MRASHLQAGDVVYVSAGLHQAASPHRVAGTVDSWTSAVRVVTNNHDTAVIHVPHVVWRVRVV